jgi:coproporphyrinogen III oxidase
MNRERFESWISHLQRRICQSLESLESVHPKPHVIPGRFIRKEWKRHNRDDMGGGTMSLLKGAVFEKAGVNISTVFGSFSDDFCKEIPGTEASGDFWASGLSIVTHPVNPHVPAVHFNVRMIQTQKTWFGGGTDLTPTFPYDEDTNDFHVALHRACDTYDPQAYMSYKKACDEYFFLPHRNEPRGVGGIFFDYVNSGSWDNDFAFLSAISEAFLFVYPHIVKRRMHTHWTSEDKYAQMIKRGKYAEFNLLYDRGTRFGLQTGGNIDAIFMSLPPAAGWE